MDHVSQMRWVYAGIMFNTDIVNWEACFSAVLYYVYVLCFYDEFTSLFFAMNIFSERISTRDNNMDSK